MDKSEQELLFYKKRSDDLGAKFLKIQEEVTSVRADERRSNLTATVIGIAYRLSGFDTSIDEFHEKFLQLIMEGLNAFSSGIYKLENGEFRAVKCLNTPPILPLDIFDDNFFFSSKKKPLSEEQFNTLGFPFVLWQYNPAINRAILICRDIEDSRLNKAFVNKDKYLLDNSLNVLSDIEQKNKIQEDEKRLKEKIETYNQQLELKVQERTQEIEDQKKIIEQKSTQIQDSINYAKRIQLALLPSDHEIENAFLDHFILYKPKSVVSGDFYFINVIGDKTIFAVADCTGHGVPGAMVSMLCTQALKTCIRDFEIYNPGKILDYVRDNIVDTFNQSGRVVNDGMDIAICVYDATTSILEYAGAFNPMICIPKTPVLGTPEDIIILKGNREPIGICDKPTPFVTSQLEIFKGDMVYLFSDGYHDQFGGENNKRLMKKVFYNLLYDKKDLPCIEQKNSLNRFFQEWKCDNDQFDDLCVLGVRF